MEPKAQILDENKLCLNSDRGVNIGSITFWIFFVAVLLTSTKNYLVFHTGVELFGAIIEICIFVITVHTYHLSKNNSLMLLGIGFLFAGITDMLHIFTFEGTSIIADGSINLSLQLVTLSKYLTVFTMLFATLYLSKSSWVMKNFSLYRILAAYMVIYILCLLSIFYFKSFPICYIEGQGPTEFKVISGYMVIPVLIVMAVLICNQRKNIGDNQFWYVEIGIGCLVFAEIFFAKFLEPYEIGNILGHALKVMFYYCIFKVIIEGGLKNPYSVLYRKIHAFNSALRNTDSMLKEERNHREELEQAIASNTQCFELLVERSKDAILIATEGKIVYANEGAEMLYGAGKPETLTGMYLEQLIPDERKAFAAERFKKVYEEKTYRPFADAKLLNINGDIIDIESGLSYITYKNRNALLCILRDVSNNKKIAKLEHDIAATKEFNRVLTEFFSNISHELKTPLNVILGAIQILGIPGKGDLPVDFEKKQNKYLWAMKQNCYRLLRLVNNLIDQSKVDSGYLKPNLRNCNIVSVVENISLSVADYTQDKGMELIFDTDTEEKITAIDVDKIERIILNLLSNAIKFSVGGDQIFVSVTDKDDKVLISVKDTGIGIPKDKLGIIFDRFGQVDKSLTRNREGSGIGLAIVKSLVEMHGGTIFVNSVLGEGSEFVVELPVRIVGEEDNIVESQMYQSNVERINVEFSDIYN
jgi:PAS domain S-box-containing protein